MARRLELQRSPSKLHQRKNSRWYVRGYDSNPHEVWGDSYWGSGIPGAGPSTGATAGIPGSWTPAGSTPPANVASLQGGSPVTVTASPATAWTTGQFVQTQTAGAAGRACWTGTGWVGGIAP